MRSWRSVASRRLARPGAFVLIAGTLGLAAAVRAATPAPGPLPGPGGEREPGVCAGVEARSQGLHVYFGDLHAHTGWSDGEGTPEGAYARARNVGQLDFLGLSDHAYALNGRPGLVSALFERAREATHPGRFVALAGGEWTESGQGHVNVFTWGELPDRERQATYTELYRWLASHEALFAQFNHPGFDIQENWDAFRYDPAADRAVELLEVGNGPVTHNVRYEASYRLALDMGWRVGAASNSDAHRAQWGTATPSRTAVWSTALEPAALVDAIRCRRTYATEDSNARLWFSTAGGGVRMGDVHRGMPAGGRMVLAVELCDPDSGDAFERVELVGSGGQVRGALETGGARAVRATFPVLVDRGEAWFYARAVQRDGDVLVSSPIWIAHPSGVRAVGLELRGTLFVRGRGYLARAVVVNDGERPVTVEARWRSPGWAGEPRRLDLGPLQVAPVEVEWVPAAAGVQDLVLEVRTMDDGAGGRPGMGRSSSNVYPIRATVRGTPLGRMAIDEGHNNRYTGLASGWLERLGRAGVDARVVQGTWDEGVLAGVDVVVAAAPEPGLSLTPIGYGPAEVEALARWVRDGGKLLLMGSLEEDGGHHGVDQLNGILAASGASLRFGHEPPEAGYLAGTAGTPGKSRVWVLELAEGILPGATLYLRSPAAILMPPVTADGGAAVDVLAAGEGPGDVVAASEQVGRGTVVLIAAPMHSPYESGARGYDDAAFQDRLVAHLLGQP